MQFAKRHSRNAHDFAYELGPDGRHTFYQRGGVWKRCGLLVTALSKQDMTRAQMVKYLANKFNASYTSSDLNAPINQLKRCGMIQNANGIYSLTHGGKDLWKAATKNFQGVPSK